MEQRVDAQHEIRFPAAAIVQADNAQQHHKTERPEQTGQCELQAQPDQQGQVRHYKDGDDRPFQFRISTHAAARTPAG